MAMASAAAYRGNNRQQWPGAQRNGANGNINERISNGEMANLMKIISAMHQE